MVMVARWLVRSTWPFARCLEIARFTTRGLERSRRAGRRSARTARPIRPVRSMVAPVTIPAARVIWSRAVFKAMVKLARSSGAAGSVPVASAIAVRSAW